MFTSRRFASFSELSPDWRRFVAEHAPTFDQTLQWFELFEKHVVGNSGPTFLVGVEESTTGAPICVLPMQAADIAVAGGIRVAGLSGLTNYYTALFGPIGPRGDECDVAAVLASALTELPVHHSVIDLNPLAADAASSLRLENAFRDHGYTTERYFRFGNWYLDVAGRTSDEYFKALPGHVRSTLQRKGKKLRAIADAAIRIVSDPEDVDTAMDAYEHVYQSSWKQDEPYKLFVREFARESASRGWLRLGVVEIGTCPVAAQIWFVYRGTASIFKLAYNEQFADLSVGSILTMTLMQHVIDVDRTATVDYLCGDDSYKRDWMSARRERVGIRAVRRASWAGLLNLAAGVARRVQLKSRRAAAISA